MMRKIKKNLRFKQIQVISNSGIFKYIFVLYFSLCMNYIGHLCICIVFGYTVHAPASELVIFFL